MAKTSALPEMAKRELRRKWWIHFLRLAYLIEEILVVCLSVEPKEPQLYPVASRAVVFEVGLAELQSDEAVFRKFKLVTEDVQVKT